jgi:hypothetical protein
MMARTTESFTITGKIVAKTKSAFLFAIYPQDSNLTIQTFAEEVADKSQDIESMWFPFSQTTRMIEEFSVLEDKLDSVSVTAWIAKQKGLI